MNIPDISKLHPDPYYNEHLGQNVWLMDNHRWAFYFWEKIRSEHFPLTRFHLVHADYHWDQIDDVEEDPEVLAQLLAASVETLRIWTARDESPIRYESFIAPAIRRRALEAVHWFCKQDEEDNGFDEEFLHEHDCCQYFYSKSSELGKASIKDPLIFDLCLDLFNRNDKDMWAGDLWSHQEIDNFLIDCGGLIHRAAAVTLSLSFGYSGSEDDTRQLASIVIPKIAQLR